jgi:beta-lactamase superfamily II metal-dependent hydrolase
VADIKYAGYPDAKLVDASGDEIQHLLWSDWIRVEEGPPPAPPPAPGRVWVRSRGTSGWIDPASMQDERIVEIVFVDVGQGDGCLLVTPDDRHVVFDAGLGDNMYRFLRWRYAGFDRPWTFDAAVITHSDQDHYGGFTQLFDEPTVGFDAVYHNGIMEERGPDPLGPQLKLSDQWYLTGLMQDRATLRDFLAETDRWQGAGNATRPQHWKRYPSLMHQLDTENRVGDISMLGIRGGAESFVPGFDVAAAGGSDRVRLRVLAPVVETVGDPAAPTPALRQFGDTPTSKGRNTGKTKNGHSVVVQLEYRDVKVLLSGDLNAPSEHFLLNHHAGMDVDHPYSEADAAALIAGARPAFGSDIAKVCHHGSSDFLDTMAAAVNPAVTVISSGDDESYAHPRPETLGALGKAGRGARPLLVSTELMRSTREHEGDARRERESLVNRIKAAQLAGDTDLVGELVDELAILDDRLFGRNVAVYGAVNVRTDGRRAIVAYRLERDARRSGSLDKWDLYRIEPGPDGRLTYQPN